MIQDALFISGPFDGVLRPIDDRFDYIKVSAITKVNILLPDQRCHISRGHYQRQYTTDSKPTNTFHWNDTKLTSTIQLK